MPNAAWSIDPAQFPANAGPAEQLAFAARFAILAPSSHNSQPWHFVIQGNRLDLKADRARALPVVDPDDRELVISCGAALHHLRLALRCFGYQPEVTLVPESVDPDLLATVRLGERRSPSDDDARLFAALPLRHTNRGPYQPREVPEEQVFALQHDAGDEQAWLYWARGMTKEAVAALIAEGDRLQLADPRFRRELSAWVHPGRAALGDGMPGPAQGLGPVAERMAPIVIRTFDVGGNRAAHDHELAVGSPVLAVIGTDHDGERDWLCAGQALARVLLRATADGMCASFLNQPIEVPTLRLRLRESLGKAGFAQLIVRLGYAERAQPSPRRPWEAVIRLAGG